MPFTTGTNASGYRLESISIDFDFGGSRTHDPVYVSLLPDNGSGQIASLTKNGINYLGPVAGVNKYSVWRAQCYPQPPHGGGCISRASSAHLDPNTRYWVYIWAGEQATSAWLNMALSPNESGAPGWTIGNSARVSPTGAAHSNYTELHVPVKMKVEGTTNPEVLVSSNDPTATEGTDETIDFVVRLSRATSGPVQVSYETFELSVSSAADEGSDYEATSGTLTFRPGETRKTVSVPILDDARNEGNETFGLVLTDLQGATFDNNSGTGTIINAEPMVLSISDATATEGVDATMDFTVTLNRATNRTVTVNLLFSLRRHTASRGTHVRVRPRLPDRLRHAGARAGATEPGTCTAPGFLDSGLTVFASTPPRPARGGRVAPGPGFGSRTSPASTARCTSA